MDMVNEEENSIDISLSLYLRFQEHIVTDLVKDDGLVILGKGLGLNQIVANLLHVLGQATIRDKKSLIMLINASEEENNFLEETLMELSWRRSNVSDETDSIIDNNKDLTERNGHNFVSLLGDAGTVDKRRKIYSNGGIISLSNRVLVTDILGDVIEANTITGLVILHAENISQYSMDRFVVNLYRKSNKWGFIKAFSEDPEKCNKGFQPLQTKLKYFKLDKSFLWPRFHIAVTESIKRKMKKTIKSDFSTPINKVTEVRIKMTDYMVKIQNSLMASIELLIGELKRNNPDIASEYWSIENALDANFVQSIMGALNPVWHRISVTTKKIVNEITILKTFLIDLFRLDSVSFYQNINSFVTEHTMSMSNKESLWLMIPEASATIACSKDRVYRKFKNMNKPSISPIDDLLLEEPPKWEQLMLILEEINEEKTAKNDSESGPILIACASRTICHQIERVLSNHKVVNEGNSKSYSFRKMMKKELKYQNWKKESSLLIRKMNTELKNVKSQREDATKEDDVVISKTFTRNKFRDSNRRRNRGGSVMSKHNRLMNMGSEENDEIINENEIIDIESSQSDDSDYELNNLEAEINQTNERTQTPEIQYEYYNSLTNDIKYDCIDRNNEVIISTFDSINLEELMPSYIICYEPSLVFVRMIELYQASLHPAKCFFMYYGESVEEQIYLNSIKHEKDSFTSLIREKANMPKFFSTEDDEQSKFNESFRHLNSKTRIAGGGLIATETNRIIVDMRDFNSQLPFVCHLAGLEVIPAMLTVGDYILSDEICVERKAVRDLIESLENGRLNKQCESMFKWYSKPVLLIEFDEGKSFSFEPFTTGFLTSNSNRYVKSNDLEQLQLRLAALMKSFPKLSIIWSSSPFETAKIFKEIKANQKDPDVEFALTAGTNGIKDGRDTNEDAIKLLKLIPGITDANSILIINKVNSLYDFCQMSVDDMSEIIGKENARKAFTFINKSCKE